VTDVEPTGAELIRRALDSRIARINVALPARVLSYNAKTRKALVEVSVRLPIQDENGDVIYEQLPDLTVPVVFPSASGFSMHFPLSKDDPVQLLFNQRSITKWRRLGARADPEDLQNHGLGDAVALPGLWPLPNVPDGEFLNDSETDMAGTDPHTPMRVNAAAVFADTDVSLGIPDSEHVRLRFTPARANFGNGDQPVALADKVADALTTLKNAIDGWTPVPNDGGAALKTALTSALAGWPPALGASNLNADE